MAEWAARAASAPVRLEGPIGGQPALPEPGVVLVGTAATVKDVGPVRLDLVAILDADRALARAGVHAGEQALATWMEAAAWAGPRAEGARVLLQTRHPAHPAIQALIRWEPGPFLLAQARARAEAGFPPGHPVFRITGSQAMDAAIAAAGPSSILTTTAEGGTLCLVAVPPEDLARFRQKILHLAGQGTVTRVEAEPQL
jgi:primosomal protein N' (replication factor Y)